ncbi:hypothetical protein [Sphingorhabdus sp. 109]|jgi:hypothetical protein|uniref:hypothetical protein n=1 Tax=Sphingorhabdus sp. 109 TaxID=2653173 RepID=UPI0012F34D55|nr:hypothetical protein [Sphingorhabdus sp. 109]VWX56751.1 conserved hypothetical protein [Sphingorhabdus sp. 109]
MAQTDLSRLRSDPENPPLRRQCALAAGLFGYSIADGRVHSFKETEGYLRDMEQMPNFVPPSASSFVAQYLASNIGKTRSSS